MARIHPEQPLVPSVLDRLLDDEPDLTQEPPRTRNQVLRELKVAVQRDIHNLLNTRRRCLGWPAALTELDRSLLNYGLPDFTGANVGSSAVREEFRRIIEEVLHRFEPRFKSVGVILLENTERLDRSLHFRIDAMLQADPAPEPIVFDSILVPATGSFEVKGGGR
jgi:type VI secretion system protein ImpF